MSLYGEGGRRIATHATGNAISTIGIILFCRRGLFCPDLHKFFTDFKFYLHIFNKKTQNYTDLVLVKKLCQLHNFLSFWAKIALFSPIVWLKKTEKLVFSENALKQICRKEKYSLFWWFLTPMCSGENRWNLDKFKANPKSS